MCTYIWSQPSCWQEYSDDNFKHPWLKRHNPFFKFGVQMCLPDLGPLADDNVKHPWLESSSSRYNPFFKFRLQYQYQFRVQIFTADVHRPYLISILLLARIFNSPKSADNVRHLWLESTNRLKPLFEFSVQMCMNLLPCWQDSPKTNGNVYVWKVCLQVLGAFVHGPPPYLVSSSSLFSEDQWQW